MLKPKLIKDLGMLYPTQKSTRKYHFSIYECTECKKHFKSQVRYINKRDTDKCKNCYSVEKNTKHGLSRSVFKSLLGSMKQRCYNKNNQLYKYYGAVGVTICNEWMDKDNGLVNFTNWCLENGYKKGLEIDKDILCDKLNISPKIYSPKTCMFINGDKNKRHTRLITSKNNSGYRGVSWDKDRNKWVVFVKNKNIGRFDNILEASSFRDKYIVDNNLDIPLNGEAV